MLTAVCVGLAIPVIGGAHEAAVPLVLRASSIGLLALAAWRPAWALLILAGVMPLAPLLRTMANAPGSLGGNEAAELFVAPVVLACTARMAIAREWTPSRLWHAGFAFALLVGLSAALQLFGVQQASGTFVPFASDLANHAWNGYFEFAEGYPALHIAIAALETMMLAVVVERLIRDERPLRQSLPRMWLTGMAGAAAYSAFRLAQVSLNKPDPWHAFTYFLVNQPISPLIPDFNAAGSLFALCAVPAIWLAVPERRIWAWPVAIVITLALWLAGSRTALAATVVGLTATWLLTRRPPRRIVAAVAAAALIAAGTFIWSHGRAHASPEYAAAVRVEMARIGLRIAAAHPIFGVGAGLFRRASLAYMTPSFIASFRPAAVGENAHNNFIQILAELGLAGLTAFVALLVMSFRGLRGAAARDGAGELPAIAGGVLAFLVTCLTGHPLVIQIVFYEFALALGLLAGLMPSLRVSGIWFAIAIAFIVIALPFRAFDVRRTANMSGVVYGTSQVLTADDGRPFRLAEDESSWFVPANAKLIVLPLRLANQSQPPCRVEVSLDGRRANEVDPAIDNWMDLDVVLPPAPGDIRSRRIDLKVANPHCWLMVGTVTPR